MHYIMQISEMCQFSFRVCMRAAAPLQSGVLALTTVFGMRSCCHVTSFTTHTHTQAHTQAHTSTQTLSISNLSFSLGWNFVTIAKKYECIKFKRRKEKRGGERDADETAFKG